MSCMPGQHGGRVATCQAIVRRGQASGWGPPRPRRRRQDLQEVGNLLPSAVAVALSPMPIVAVVLVLSSQRARTAGPAFAIAWIAGRAAVSAVVVLVLPRGTDADGDDPAWPG